MKRRLMALSAILCLVGLFVFAATASANVNIPIQPMYTDTQSISATLSNSSGTATCKGTVYASSSSSKVSIVVTLKKKVGTTWSKVDSWSGSGTGDASAKGTKSLTKGYEYKVVVTGQIKNSSGKLLESVSKESKVLAY